MRIRGKGVGHDQWQVQGGQRQHCYKKNFQDERATYSFTFYIRCHHNSSTSRATQWARTPKSACGRESLKDCRDRGSRLPKWHDLKVMHVVWGHVVPVDGAGLWLV